MTLMTTLLREAVEPLVGSPADYDPVLKAVGGARLVLLGEASHGTHEFYRARAQITQRLIREKGFSAVLVEADWPDACRVNQHQSPMENPPPPMFRSRLRYGSARGHRG